jgi:hypothetical protein
MAKDLETLALRAYRASAQIYGRPVPGGSGSLQLDATNKTADLRGGFLYVFTALGGDAIFAIDSPAGGGSSQILPAGASFALTPGPDGRTPQLNATQGPAAGGTLYWTAYEDVG